MSHRTRATRHLLPVLAAALACLVGSSSPGQAFRYALPTFPQDKQACLSIAAQLSADLIDPNTIMQDPGLAAGAKVDTFGWTPERVVAVFNEEIAALVARMGADAVVGAKCLSRMSLARANVLSVHIVVHHDPWCQTHPDKGELCYYGADLHRFWCGADGCRYLYGPYRLLIGLSPGDRPLDLRSRIRNEVGYFEREIKAAMR